MIVVLLVLAGGLGAVTRSVVDGMLKARLGEHLPWATFVINVSGSLLLGLLTGLVLHQGTPDGWRTVLGTGFCGGYTTFSTASFETVRLVQRDTQWTAAGYAVGSYVFAAAAAALGLVLTA